MVDPTFYITHRVKFEGQKDVFETWLNPSMGMINGVVVLN